MNPILTQLYPALCRHAAQLLSRFPGCRLQPEDLLHMAIERILHRPPPESLQVPAVIRGLVVTVMNRVLVDEWRRQSAARRPDLAGAVPLDDAGEIAAAEPCSWPDVTEALDSLRSEQPEAAELIELRFFRGVRQCQIARDLQVSNATISRRWRMAAAWLRNSLTAAGTERAPELAA